MTSTSAPDWSFLSPELRGGGAATHSADGRSECGCVDLHQVILVSCCTHLPSDWLTARPLEPVQVTSCLSLLVLQGSTDDTSISCGLMSLCVSLQRKILFLHHTASFTPLSGGSGVTSLQGRKWALPEVLREAGRGVRPSPRSLLLKQHISSSARPSLIFINIYRP